MLLCWTLLKGCDSRGKNPSWTLDTVVSKFSKFRVFISLWDSASRRLRAIPSLRSLDMGMYGSINVVSVPVVNANSFFPGPARSDDQPRIRTDLLHVARSRESRVISSIRPLIHFVMLPIHGVFTPSLPMNFPLYHIQLAAAVSDVVAREGELAAHNKSEKLYSRTVLSSVRILWYVRCSVQLTRNINGCLYHKVTRNNGKEEITVQN